MLYFKEKCTKDESINGWHVSHLTFDAAIFLKKCQLVNPSSSRPTEVRHLQRAHRQSQTPHRSKQRAHQLGVVVISAMAKHQGYLVKYQATARDDDVKNDEGQQGFGVKVHWCPLFCFCPGG